MKRTTDRLLIVGLDIGTSKVSVLVSEILPDGAINALGVGTTSSQGMDKGGVNDLELVVKSVERAVNDAEFMSDCKIHSVFLSLSGKHIHCQTERGMGMITDEEVTQNDVEMVIHTAQSVKISDEQRVLHVIPQEYKIDYQAGIRNPVGLLGVRMEASVHLITCHNDTAKNIEKAVERCGLKVDQLIFSGLASSHSVITADEQELGVCVVDIGGGTMDIAVWTGGALRHASVIPYAGNVVTSDIAYAFGTPLSDAEKLKVKYGCALSELVNKDAKVNVPSVGGRLARSLQRQTLAEVIEPRCSELLSLIQQELKRVQERLCAQGVKHQLAAGIVLTGGSAQMLGLVECAERVFQNQVRVGFPAGVAGLTNYIDVPYHATVVGLLHYGKDNLLNEVNESESKHTVSAMFSRFSSWLKKEF
ncbi:cell division protein FtsA [Candidatus Enterovibrio altilux]|uniref:Cell division protein FtsA n=1 Tax=Candidatus Enterovibrio altilux TaxID=1927128 RepID=A0A291B7I6_9GAMM|nr:cell division protein FtsA [Candidatus Enterovibrio luxaltus]ATF08965.1 Cell division protein FtsA [Candidatus Enterovibrio luxaltus]